MHVQTSECAGDVCRQGEEKRLQPCLLEALGEPDGRLPGRHLLGAERLQQDPQLLVPLLLQQLRAELEQAFQRLSPLLVRRRVEPPLPGVRRAPAGRGGGVAARGTVAPAVTIGGAERLRRALVLGERSVDEWRRGRA